MRRPHRLVFVYQAQSKRWNPCPSPSTGTTPTQIHDDLIHGELLTEMRIGTRCPANNDERTSLSFDDDFAAIDLLHPSRLEDFQSPRSWLSTFDLPSTPDLQLSAYESCNRLLFFCTMIIRSHTARSRLLANNSTHRIGRRICSAFEYPSY